MIRYRYALNELDELVDINQIATSSPARYFAIDSGQELIPKVGLIRRHHFAHKTDLESASSLETYLHALGKKVFYQVYSKCLENNIPYYLQYVSENQCNRLESTYKERCYSSTLQHTNLCEHFDQIAIEKNNGSFIPDILLSSSKSAKTIYIEIAVTHKSSDQKIESRNSIIEFQLSSDKDLSIIENLEEAQINRPESVKLYNFKQVRTQINCEPYNCQQDFYFFLIDQEGRGVINVCNEQAANNAKDLFKYASILPKRESSNKSQYLEMYKGFVIEANSRHAPIKDCFVCRYHTMKNTININEAIFCKYLRITCNSNYASECSAFKAVKVG